MRPTIRRATALLVPLSLLAAAACGDDSTGPDVPEFFRSELGLVVNSVSGTVTLFQLAAPANRQELTFGASAALTPTSLATRGTRIAVPLGDAASVAVVDAAQGAAASGIRYFTMPRGNATGAAWVDDNTVIVANLVDDYVGRFTLDQSGTQITQTLTVTPAPTDVAVSGTRAYVVSGNLDANFTPLGNGVVTEVDARALTATGRTAALGRNPQGAALHDGRLYVVNTGDFDLTTFDYAGPATVSVVNVGTMQVERTITGFQRGASSIVIDGGGLAYVSSFGGGTVVYNTASGQFVRGPDNPACVRAGGASSACRSVGGVAVAGDGTVYQTLFGTGRAPSYVFTLAPQTFQVRDSIAVGVGPTSIELHTFR